MWHLQISCEESSRKQRFQESGLTSIIDKILKRGCGSSDIRNQGRDRGMKWIWTENDSFRIKSPPAFKMDPHLILDLFYLSSPSESEMCS